MINFHSSGVFLTGKTKLSWHQQKHSIKIPINAFGASDSLLGLLHQIQSNLNTAYSTLWSCQFQPPTLLKKITKFLTELKISKDRNTIKNGKNKS